MKTRNHTRWSLVVAVLVLVLALAPAAEGQEERRDPQDVAASGSDMLTRSDLGNVAQSARMEYAKGERSLKRAAKLETKLEKLEGKKLESAQKNIERSYVDAEQAFREALGFNSKMAEAYAGLGIALRAQGKFKESLQAVVLGLRLAPEDDELFTGWAESLMGLNMLGDATQAYGTLHETNPERARLLLGIMQGWLTAHQANPGEVDPADVVRLADWIAQQRGSEG